MNHSPRLIARDLTVSFGGGAPWNAPRHQVLHGIDLDLKSAEILALVGESGSGKSTLARAIAGLIPHGGRLSYSGGAPRVQMVFQDPYASLNPAHRVAHHVMRPLRLRGLAKADAQSAMRKLLHEVGLSPADEIAQRYPHDLSGGQRQRVAIARALAAAPDVLLADEPTSMLDVSVRMSVLDLLRRLRDERGLSVVLITHDLAAARWVADRIAVLYQGHLVEQGPAATLLAEPRHPYTQLLAAAAARDPEALRRSLPERRDPSHDRDDTGCPFAPRCPRTASACLAALPAAHTVGPGQEVRCLQWESADG